MVYYTEGAMKGKSKKKVTHLRKKESLPFYLIAKPTSPMERQQNREILEMAEKIRFEKKQELKEQQTGFFTSIFFYITKWLSKLNTGRSDIADKITPWKKSRLSI